MTPTLHVLPRCRLELRTARGEQPSRQGRFYRLLSRDDRARPAWELSLSAPVARALLEALSDGEMVVNAGPVRLQVYPDPELEKDMSAWAVRELARMGGPDLPPRLRPRPHTVHVLPVRML